MKKLAILSLGLAIAASSCCATAAKTDTLDSAGEGPDVSTATYGDWVVTCRSLRNEETKKSEKFCEIVQTLQAGLPSNEGGAAETRTIAQLALGKVTPKEQFTLTVVVPVDIKLPTQMTVDVDGAGGSRPLNLPWARCFFRGCFASLTLTEEILNLLRKGSTSGTLQWQAGNGQNVQVKFSLRGLPQALAQFETIARGK